MIAPSVLEIEGVRSFKDRAVISFPPSGAVLISGKYTGSSVSSGSGKSTVLMAIAYALGYCPVPATELKTWGSKNLFVKLVLTDGDLSYTITRDPKLKLETPSGVLEGTAAEEELTKILKAPAELAKTLTYRAQREPGAFIAKTDAEKKDMLTSLLGLSALETAYEKEKAQISASEMKLSGLKARIDALQAQNPPCTVDEFKKLYDDYVAAYQRYNEIQAVDIRQMQVTLENITIEIGKCMKAASAAASARSEMSSVDRNIEQINASIRTLHEGICFTCKQPWHKSGAAIEAGETQLASLRAKRVELDSLVRNAHVLEQSLPGWRAEEQKVQAAMYSAAAPRQDAYNALSSAQNAFQSADRAMKQFEQVAADRAKTSAEHSQVESDLVVMKHVAEILGRNGFLSVIFDEVLAEIERMANEIISDIPNVCEFSISIDSVSTTKSGNTKKSISVVLNKDGREVSVKTLSGGQRCAVDLAVDLAISDAIRRRSGTSLGWIALDEAMDGLDIETKRSALEAIKSRVHGLLLVVDHSTEIKEAFETVVEIEFDGRHSKVL